MSSLTESDLYKDASGPLYVKQLSALKAVMGCKIATGYELFLSWLTEMTRVYCQGGAEGAARLLLLRLERSVRWLLRNSIV